MKMNYKKGFTLIELLVVIAIIGILSSVVLASLNTARDKGADAAIKGNLSNIRAQAEIVYDNDPANGYSTLFSAGPALNAVTAADSANGTGGVYRSNASSTWVVSAKLKGAGAYCVDWKGSATTTAALQSTGTECQ